MVMAASVANLIIFTLLIAGSSTPASRLFLIFPLTKSSPAYLVRFKEVRLHETIKSNRNILKIKRRGGGEREGEREREREGEGEGEREGEGGEGERGRGEK